MEYERYKDLVDYYFENDNREVNYQNRIIIPFLESLIGDEGYRNVIDSSTLYKNWKGIGREDFAGIHTPDIIIASDWKLFKNPDEKNADEYLMLIDVKTPSANDRSHAMAEIGEYIQKKKKTVILTDCVTWEFWENGEKTSPIYLEQEYDKKVEAEDKRCKSGKRIDNVHYPAWVCKRYCDDNDRKIHWKSDKETWMDLCKRLKGFFLQEK